MSTRHESPRPAKTPVQRAKQIMAEYLVRCHEYSQEEAEARINTATAGQRVELLVEVYVALRYQKHTTDGWYFANEHELLLLIQDLFDLDSIQKWWEKNGLRYQ